MRLLLPAHVPCSHGSAAGRVSPGTSCPLIGAVRPGAAAAAPARCPAASLRVWLGVPGDGYAGGTAYQLELSNVSFRACARRGLVYLNVRTTVAGTGIPGFSR